ncbi:MAG: CARDB domain-containing protein [Myxococcota bacterium]|nr:CARDB domain-containing protein [Myxococcota bacterium]
MRGLLALLAALVCAAAPALAGEPTPKFPFDIPQGAYQATFIEDIDFITHMEFAGDYNRNLPDGSPNLPARAVVAQEFFRTHPDEVDFLVTFTTFEFESGDAIAFHQGVRNEVEGLGIPIYDNSALYGSERLLGFIEMAATSRYELNPFAPGYEQVLTTLAHETLHQWGCFVRYRDANGDVSGELLGPDDAHWSFLLDTEASVEYGHRWRDNGDGSFTAVDARRFYSPLDLYLMGLLAPEEVPDFFRIDSTDADRTELPLKGTVVSGAAETVSIDDIIDVEGPRFPDSTSSQKEFRYAFVILTPPGEEPSPEVLARLASVRRDFADRFAIMTGGRARAAIYPQALPAAEIGEAGFVTAGPLRTTGASVADGLAWLRSVQDADGSWADKEGTRVRDTAEVFRVLSELDPLAPALADARIFLLSQAGLDTDSLARLIQALGPVAGAENLAELLARQNADGGWGLNPGDLSDALDTALAVLALDSFGNSEAASNAGLGFLAARQNPDGGWPAGERGPSNVLATSQALLALGQAGGDAAALEAGLLFLIARQNADGGFGVAGSSVHETSLAVATLIALNRADDVDLGAARDYIDSRQAVEGSWNGSTYGSALAVLALQSLDFPNWRIESIEADDDVLLDGERTRIEIFVVNDGKDPLPGGSLRILDGDAATGEVLDTVILPPLAPLQALTIEFFFDSFDRPGERTITAFADPDGLVEERSEGDNVRSVSITVDPAPSGIDLELTGADVAIVPQNPFTLPTDLGISANVRNLGDTDATAVGVQLWRGPPDEDESELLQETTVDVLARTNRLVNLSHPLTLPGTTTFFVVVDSDDAVVELAEDNNQASASVTTQDSVDLEVDGAAVTVTPSPALLGQDVVLEVPLRNRGTTAAPPTQARFAIQGDGFFQELAVVDLSLEAGETVIQSVVWRVDRLGSFSFTAEIDFADVIPELSETNNQAAVGFDSQVVTGENVRVDFRDLSFDPNPALEGAAATLSAVVLNSGTLDLTDVVVAFFDGNPEQGAPEIARTQVAILVAGASAPVSVVWSQVPSSADRVIHVVADPDGAVAEFDETDNRAFENLPVLALPDLAVSAGGIRPSPAFPKEGETITIAVEVVNLGAQPADNALVRIFAGDPDAGGVLIGSDTLASLAPFTSAMTQFGYVLPAGIETQDLVVVVDPDDAVVEGNEANNRAARPVALQTGNSFVSQPFVSPNGDDLQEGSDFFFALDTPAEVTVVVVNDLGQIVRRAPAEAFEGPVSDGQFTWDGRTDAGRLAPDGAYRIQARNVLDEIVAEAIVVIDTNRSALLDAVGTPFALFTNLTQRLGDFDSARGGFFNETVLLASPDDEFIYFAPGFGYRQEARFPPGVYRARSNGTGAAQIVEGGEDIYTNPEGFTLLALSESGETLLFNRGSSCGLWVVGTDGTNPRELPDSPSCGDIYSSEEGPTFLDEETLFYLTRRFSDVRFFTHPIDGTASPTEAAVYDDFYRFDDIFKTEVRGRKVLVQAFDSRFGTHAQVVDLDAATVTRIGPVAGFEPEGNRLAVLEAVTGTLEIRAADGTVTQAVPLPVRSGSLEPIAPSLEWSEDGRYIALEYWVNGNDCPEFNSGNPGGLFVIDLQSGDVSQKSVASKTLLCGFGDSFHVFSPSGDGFEREGALHHPVEYEGRMLELEHADWSDGALTLRIEQRGHEEAEIDRVLLVDEQGRVHHPQAARNLETGADVLEAILQEDRHIAPAHEQTFELAWEGIEPSEGLQLHLVAREASLSGWKLRPFSYPSSKHGFGFELGSEGPLVVDGLPGPDDALPAPLFDAWSEPDTGHPDGRVRGWLKNDETYLYAALDFTVDNNPEGPADWASISVRRRPEDEWQSFRITAEDQRHGAVGFGRTEAAAHPHKYYEFQLALADLGVEPGDRVEVRFDAYGSAGVLDPTMRDVFTPFSLVDGIPETFFFGTEFFVGNSEPRDQGARWLPNTTEILYSTTILLEGFQDEDWGVSGTRIQLDREPEYSAIFPERLPILFRPSPNGSFLSFTSLLEGGDFTECCGQDIFTFRSLLNLTADLRALRSATQPGILLDGTASDENFAEYVLEYRDVVEGSPWMPITPPSSVPVVDDRFTTWVPPAPGSYFVRLTARDLAGNERSNVQRVSWNDRTPITDLRTDAPQISPDGNGVLDAVTLRFRVLEPVNLEFVVLDEQGNAVRMLSGSFDQVGEEGEFGWDGRDDAGLLVPDGDYRLMVGGFEFFVTIDVDAPSVVEETEELLAFVDKTGATCDLENASLECFVDLRPAYRASVFDANLDEILIESKPRTAGSWSLDDSAEVLNAPLQDGTRNLVITPKRGFDTTDPLEPRTALGEQMRKLTELDYRVRAVDFAGNETILLFSAGQKRDRVVVLGNGNHQILLDPDLTRNIAESTRVERPYAPNRNLYPGRRPSELRLGVIETLDVEIQDVFVDFRPTGEVDWDTAPATDFIGVARQPEPDPILAGALLGSRSDHLFQLLLDPRALGSGPLDFRVRLVDTSGGEHSSNEFNLVFTQGVGLVVNENRDFVVEDLSPILISLDVSFQVESIDLFVESPTDEAFRPKLLVQTVTPSDDPTLLAGSGNVELEPLPLQACNDYVFTAVVRGEGNEAITTKAVEFACFSVGVRSVEPVHAEVCGTTPTDEILIELAVVNENFEDFALTQLILGVEQPSGPPDVLFNVIAPRAGPSIGSPALYQFVFDTSPYADGVRVPLVAELTNEVGDTVGRPIPIAIDHTPPELEITSPLEGQLVCAEQLRKTDVPAGGGATQGVEIQARLIDRHAGAEYEPELTFIEREVVDLDLDSRVAIDGEDFEGFDLERAETGEVLRPAPRRLGLRRDTVVANGLQYVVETERSGEFGVRLEVLDFGTFRTCEERRFVVDAVVDGASAVLTTSPYFSPNADGFSDALEFSFFTGEPVDVTVEVFAANPATGAETRSPLTVQDPQGRVFVVPDATPVAQVLDALPALPGETLLTWDGSNGLGGFVSDGDYLVELTARDGCRNVFRKRFYARLDTTPPDVQILAPLPAGPIGVVTEVIGTADDGALAEFQLELASGLAPDAFQTLATGDDAVVAQLLGVWNTHGLIGDYDLRLVATDRSGNTAETTLAFNLAERLNLLTDYRLLGNFVSPNGDGRRETLPIRWNASADVLVTLEVLSAQGGVVRTLLADVPYAPGASTVSWDARDELGELVADASYDLRITAKLASNPFQTQTETLRGTVDSVAPSVDVTEILDGFLQVAQVPEASVEDAHLERFEVAIAPAGSGFVPLVEGTLPVNALPIVLDSESEFPDGDYVLRAFAVDKGESQTELRIDLVIDREPPMVVLEGPADGASFPAGDTERAATGLVEEPNLAIYELVLRNESGQEDVLFSATQIPADAELGRFSLAGKADGSYTLQLRAVDRAGNQATAGRSLSVDSLAPTVEFTAPQEGGFVLADGEIRGVVDDANPGEYELLFSPVAIDDVGQATSLVLAQGSRNGLLYTWRAPPPDGQYRLYLRAQDRAENAALASIAVTLDTTPPSPPAIDELAFDPDRNVTVDWSASPEPDVAGYLVERDGNRVTPAPVPGRSFVDPAVEEGERRYRVIAVDAAGNESEPSEPGTLRVDVTPPDVRITAPAPDELVSGLVDVRGIATSDDDFAAYRVLAGAGAAPASFEPVGGATVPSTGGVLAQWSTIDGAEGVFTIRLEAEDDLGNLGSTEIQVTVDNAPPTAPSNLQAVVTDDDVALTWAANPDTDLAGYLLFRDGRLVNLEGTLVGSPLPFALPGTSYDDLDLGDDTYTYTLFAIDEAGNVSGPSTAVDATIELGAPHVELAEPQPGDLFDATLTITPTSEDGDIAQVVFEIRAAGTVDPFAELGRATSEPFGVVADTQSLAFGDYELRAVASDFSGNVDPAPTVITVTRQDLVPPDPVETVTALADGGDVQIDWSAVDAPDLARYRIIRIRRTFQGFDPFTAVELDNSADPLATTFLDADIDRDAEYRYEVEALDDSGNASEETLAEPVPVFGLVVPGPPTPTVEVEVVLEVTSVFAGVIEVEVDNASGSSVLDLGPIEAGVATPTVPVALEPGDNFLTVRVVDPVGNRSRPTLLKVARGDPPSAPTGLTTSASGFDVTASWNANPEPNVIGYQLFRDGESVTGDEIARFTGTNLFSATIDSNPFSCQEFFFSQALSTDFEFQLPAARPVSGIEFRQGTRNWLTPFDFDVLAWTGSSWVPVAQVRAARPEPGLRPEHVFFADFDPYLTDRIRIDVLQISSSFRSPQARRFTFQVCDVQAVASVLITDTTYVDQGVIDGVREYTVRAVNDLGFFSELSEPSLVPVGDATPPDVVTLSGSVAGPDVSLSWPRSAAPDVASYRVFRDGSEIGTVTDDGSPSFVFVDAGRRNGTYSYTVRGTDDKGNESVDSTPFVAVVAVAPPPPPEDFSAVPEPTGNAVTLSWSPAPGSTPAAYAIYRSADGGPLELIAVVPETSFVDGDVEPGVQYTYLVRAVDPYENESLDSQLVTVDVVDTVPPDPPSISAPTQPGIPYRTALDALTVAGSAEPGAEVFLLRADDPLAGTFASQEIVVERLAPPGEFSEFRDYVLARQQGDWALARLNAQDLLEIVDTRTGESLISFPDVDEVALDDRGGKVYLGDADTGGLRVLDVFEGVTEPIDLGVTPIDFDDMALSPDGTLLLMDMQTETQVGLWLHDLEAGTTELLVQLSLRGRTIRVSPDNRYVTYSANSGERFVLDLETRATFTLQGGGQNWADADWSPDSSRLVYQVVSGGATGFDLFFWDPETGIETPFVQEEGNQRLPVWSPDGGSIAWVLDRPYGEPDALAVRDLAEGTEEIVYESAGNDLRSAFWTRTNRLRSVESPDLVVLEMPGSFAFEDVEVASGENRFSAAALDAAGNEGVPSDEIQVIRVAGSIPDLIAEIATAPAVPYVDNLAEVQVTVRNQGGVDAFDVPLDLLVEAPDGSTETLLAGQRVDFLPSGSAAVVRVGWTPQSDGSHRIVASVDPEGEIPEADSRNNVASRNVGVNALGGPAVVVSVLPADVAIDADLGVELEVRNAGLRLQGAVELLVEDPAGSFVAFIDTLPVDLATGDTLGISSFWNVGRTFAGSYRVVARLADRTGFVEAVSEAPFEILPDEVVVLDLLSDRARYSDNTDARIVGTASRLGGNSLLVGGTAALRITRGTEEIFTDEVPLGALLPDGQAEFEFVWNTGSAASDTYTASVELAAADGRVLATESVPIDVVMSAARIDGTLAPAQASVPLGDAIEATFTVEDVGNAPLPGTTVTVALLEASSLAEAATQSFAFDLEVGVPQSGAASFASALLPVGSYQIELRSETPFGGEVLRQRLAFELVSVIDIVGPAVNISRPEEGAVLNAQLTTLRVDAADLSSGVARVEASFDGGDFVALALGPNGFEADLRDLAEGAHTVQARAFDGAGNVSPVDQRAFTVDDTPPVITVTGVSDGQLSNQPVTPVVTVTDANPLEQTIRLNAQDFASGTPVEADGNYVLSVTATDAAGNGAGEVVSFRVDRTPPAAPMITSHSDGEVLGVPMVRITGQAEPGARVTLELGTQPVREAAADGLGDFEFLDVTLEEGENELRFVATDAAGNQSPETLLGLTLRLAAQGSVIYGHVSWRPLDGLTVELRLENAFLRDAYTDCVDPASLVFVACSSADGLPEAGDVIAETVGRIRLDFGDGSAPAGSPLDLGDGEPGPLLYLVTSADPEENVLQAMALDAASLPVVDPVLSHTYASAGDYLVVPVGGTRLAGTGDEVFDGLNDHLNNPDLDWRLETVVNAGSGNASPVASLPPIVRCPIDGLCSFPVTALDPDGDALSFGLAAGAEAAPSGETFVQPGPPFAPVAASVDALTGEFQWDTTGAALSGEPGARSLYSAQVTVDDGAARAAIEFLIELVPVDPTAPVITATREAQDACGSSLEVNAGQLLLLDVEASDPGAGEQVVLNVAGLPEGAALAPALPVTGNPASSSFAWTPLDSQLGARVLAFHARSSGGGLALCPVAVQVVEAGITIEFDTPITSTSGDEDDDGGGSDDDDGGDSDDDDDGGGGDDDDDGGDSDDDDGSGGSDVVLVTLTLREPAADTVAFTVSIPAGEGDLLGFFGNVEDETLVSQLALNDPEGQVAASRFDVDDVDRVGSGNDVEPVDEWDWGVRFQSLGGGPVESASFELVAPGLTIDQILNAVNQGWIVGVRIESTVGPEGSAKIGLGTGAP